MAPISSNSCNSHSTMASPHFKMCSFSFLFSLLSMITYNIAMAAASPRYLQVCSPSDHGPIIPTTPLVTFLERVQETALTTFGSKGFDPKLYVDLSLKFDLQTTTQAFDNLHRLENGSVLATDFNGFLDGYLEGADEDLVFVEPVDFVAEPVGFLPKVENKEMRDWALEVHSLWKNLSRKVADRVVERPDFHTLLPLPNSVIIPGSRFREVYYWDSYWVIR